MAAPTFVGAGAGVTIATGSGAVTAAGSGVAVGDLIVLQVLQDGTAASAVTYSAISGIANLAGTASSLTTLATDQPCGSPTLAKQHLRVGRATSTTCSVTVATTGDDLYYRIYVFRDVNTGTALTDILENGTAGTVSNGFGLAAAIADTGVTTLGADRLALQFVAVDDDNPVGAFTGMTGGVWAEAVAEFVSATGTDGCIQLQIGNVSSIFYWPEITVSSSARLIQGGSGANEKAAQSFSSGAGGTATQVSYFAYKTGSPTDDLVVEIQTDASGSPSGTVVGSSGSRPASGLQAFSLYGGYVQANISAALAAGTTYWLVWSRSGARDTSNYASIVYDTSVVGAYASGLAKGSNSGVWSTLLNIDLFFAVGYDTAGTIDGGSYTMVASDNWGVLGFALIPVAAAPSFTPKPRLLVRPGVTVLRAGVR